MSLSPLLRFAIILLLATTFQAPPFAGWLRTAAAKMWPRLLLCVAFLLSAVLLSHAQTGPINVTTTAVPFLQIAPDARSSGMGDMGIATDATDAYDGMHNTAKVPFSADPSAIGVTYTPWLRNIVQNMYLLSASGYHQLDEHSGVSGALRYFDLGDVAVTDYNGNPLTTAHPREYSLEGGYSRKLSAVLGIGLTARYIHSDLGSGSVGGTTYMAANAGAVDVSLYYDGRNVVASGSGAGSSGSSGPGWTAGLVASNLGSTLNYSNDATARDYQPANLGIGVGYTGVINEDNRWTVSAEGNKLLVPATPNDSAGLAKYHSMSLPSSWGQSFRNSAYKFSVGAEYGYMNEFFLRAGYVTETTQEGGLKYFTAGVGVKYAAFGLDFSYLAPSGNGVTQSPVSNTFRLGLVFKWK